MIDIIHQDSDIQMTLEDFTQQCYDHSYSFYTGSRQIINSCPKLILQELVGLVGKHVHLQSIADVMRIVSAAGIAQIRCTCNFQKIMSNITEKEKANPALIHMRDLDRHYHVELGSDNIRLPCDLFVYVAVQREYVAAYLRIPKDEVVTIALVAGLASSEIWVPMPRKQMFEICFQRFQKWMRDQLS